MDQKATDPAVREALEWLVRLRDDQAGEADREAFRAWVERDPANAAAWAHAQALWTRFDIARPEIDRLRRSRKLTSRRNLLLAGFATLAGAGGLGLLGRPDLLADVTTAVGERRSLTLADGSAVELGTWSALSVDFTATARRVALFRGEAFFDVAADPARPFSVTAGPGTTQALGTRFDVKLLDGVVTVAVDAHAVTVRTGAAPAVEVGRGFQVSYGEEGRGPVVPADLAAVAAWRTDRIVVQDVPLRRVLAELERYRRGRIVLTTSRIGAIPVTAIFDTREPEAALRTIADTLPVRLVHAGPFATFVTPAW
ncbi:FecR domain-containing protein [Rhodoplanes sp. TEM]|uniref:FecR domain-containing protein n=1 Tax=Rhodoplanes tepidamans TaxID=200616 RepID=A0ABT5JEI7_RHOTP|nr:MULTISPECIES: FecR domain-containing protein [Rhodoplanes]MDC7788024.1 FecR domain-containing protein [Rhodoplanes tepidamans]MDC7987897.1 FecR domain-containing protein [Rhodoplanes sp. TEM]MDQ0353987.1 transmembrane sensor [Rhodoplanes tepidamans]